MEKRIIEILKELQEVKYALKLSIDDNTLFSEAVSCFRGEMAGKSKKVENNPVSAPKTEDLKPTSGQLDFIKKNREDLAKQGFNVSPKTKKEAWKTIKDFKERNNLNKEAI